MACIFQATIGGKFASLIGLRHEDMDNTAVTDEANEQLGNEYRRKSHGSPEMFSTSVMRGVIRRRSSIKQKG